MASKDKNGGEAWVRMSWTLGLAQMGCDVWFVEQIKRPSLQSVAWFRRVTSLFGLTERSTLIDEFGKVLAGPDLSLLTAFASNSELLVNLSGNLRSREVLAACRRRAFLDLDPGYTQSWMEQGVDVGAAGHHLYFSIAERIGQPGCSLPTAGVDWLPARQPVVLSQWPV
jgi:hypothetical protein